MKMRKNIPELDPNCHHYFEPDESLSDILDTKGHSYYICAECHGYKIIRKNNGDTKGNFFGVLTREVQKIYDEFQDPVV
jgi:hypothetical protein